MTADQRICSAAPVPKSDRARQLTTMFGGMHTHVLLRLESAAVILDFIYVGHPLSGQSQSGYWTHVSEGCCNALLFCALVIIRV